MPEHLPFWGGVASGPLVIGGMSLLMSYKAAWIGAVCHLIVGFFLVLIALGYERPAVAKGFGVGMGLALLLSIPSLVQTFL